MQYMLLIYSALDAGPQTDEEQAAEMPAWFAFTEELVQAGAMVGGEALQLPETATTVQVRDGARITTDGPFAETKEILGGYYIIDVENLDQAIEWAEKIPAAPYGSIEVRPVMDTSGMGE